MAGIAGLLLAAGGGRRFGGAKALARTTGGTLFTDRAVTALRDGGCAPVVVVLGADADRVRGEAALDGTTAVDNPEWATGMGSSLRRGLAALAATDAAAALVLLVDTPGIGADAVARVAAAAAPDPAQALVVATYRGERGHPVLIGREHWAAVADSAHGDRGARAYLAARPGDVLAVECADVAVGVDVDTPGDATRF